MPRMMVRGFAWYAYPDLFGVENEDEVDPGHPFATPQGEIVTPPEVIYFRRANPADTGCHNEQRAHAYLVMTKTQLHPKTCKTWETEPAALAEGFKTQDGKVRMTRLIQKHHRHVGDLVECELKVEED